MLAMMVSACSREVSQPLRIGVVHSLTGTMAINEAPLVEAVRMAADEINQQGGVLGRRLEVVVADSRSQPAQAAMEAERLIRRERVDVLFACWTSSCRQAVKPVVEKYQHLMFYPVQYEGLELSPNIVYTGSTANQQIIPGTQWALQNLPHNKAAKQTTTQTTTQTTKRIFIIGSDYIFPRLASHIIRDVARMKNAQIVGEMYRPLGSDDFIGVAEAIHQANPDVVINCLNGDSNVAFFSALQDAGLHHLPVMSFSVDTNGLRALEPIGHAEHYAVWGYFQDLAGDENKRFVSAWRAWQHKHFQHNGVNVPLSDPIEAAYIGVKLWAQAVTAAGSAQLDVVNLAITRQTVQAPSGVLAVDATSRHLWKPVRIGKSRAQGGFEIVFDLGETLRPEPFPIYRTREEWLRIVNTVATQIQPD